MTFLLVAALPVCGISDEKKEGKLKSVAETVMLKYDFEDSQQLKYCKPWVLEPQKMTIVIDEDTDNH